MWIQGLPAVLLLAALAGSTLLHQTLALTGTSTSASVYLEPVPWFNATGCPDWIHKYAKWHTATKGTAGARYLVYSCAANGTNCLFGLGDRLRGIEFLARLAVASNRVLLVDIPSPLPFAMLFSPSLIDWTIVGLTVPAKARYIAGGPKGMLLNTTVAEVLADSGKDAWILIEGNHESHVKTIPGAPDVSWVGQDTHCLFRALFVPSPGVEEGRKQLMLAMGFKPGAQQQPYIALHIRLGGLVGEGNIHRFEEMTALHHGIRCSKALAAEHGLSENIVIITDCIELKLLIMEGGLMGVQTTRVVPVHLGLTSNYSLPHDLYIHTVSDLGVLANARCMVADGDGGFGSQARLWGGFPADGKPTCFKELRQCMQEGLARQVSVEKMHSFDRVATGGPAKAATAVSGSNPTTAAS